ncbi:3-oxoacyl-[acyl-carrier-protein] reductase, variant [Magnaporthiopsis poae ATCC 64411]|nr:3-oxoacyl-[acyl-carrier-protein] reductase, variant [Magnaporthiopsis poae ATCC 64411]
MYRLAGKNAIITGAAGGIGLETSILFAKEGARVLMADISPEALSKAQAKVLSLVPEAKVETVKCDVSKEAEVKAMVESLDSWGGVDVMFNNAGIMHADDADAIDTPEAIWDLTHNINVKGVWFGSKHAVLSLRRHNKTKGSIINTASVVALVGASPFDKLASPRSTQTIRFTLSSRSVGGRITRIADLLHPFCQGVRGVGGPPDPKWAYTASKVAVLALTRELAIVHAREGFRFNNLCPAPLNTPLLQDWLGDDKAKRQRREVHFPTGRFGEAVEQAHPVVFLASDESSFVNGHDFVVDGGMTKAYVTPEGPPLAAPTNNANKSSLD